MKFLINKIVGLSGFILVLIFWTIIYANQTYSTLIIPSPFDVFRSLVRLWFDHNFIISFGVTVFRILIAFIFSALIGVFLGIIIGYYKILDLGTKWLIDFLRSIPGITLLPLFILFFGITNLSRMLVTMFITIPTVLINTKDGVIYSTELRKNFHKLYKINKFKMFTYVILPEASPSIFSGLKISLSLTIILIIVTEMIMGSKYGIGHFIINSQYQFDTDDLYGIIIILGIVGFVLNVLLNKIENKIFHWKIK